MKIFNNQNIISESIYGNLDDYRKSYSLNLPFPHIVIDNFLTGDAAEFIYNNFPTINQMPSIFREPMSYKGQLSDIEGKWPQFKRVFDELQSDKFRLFLSKLSGINDLISDPILAGGGLHQSPKSGFLDIHVDANFHPLHKDLHRRLNIIIYVNKEWQSHWGGDLELWNDVGNKPGELGAKVEPKFNRAVIFSTTRTSWHGVRPVNCPEGHSRKSLALYYYTDTRPAAEQYEDSSVIWMSKSSPFKKALYPVLNFSIKLLKPYAKYIRRNVFDASKKD
jgi:hypothetical protein